MREVDEKLVVLCLCCVFSVQAPSNPQLLYCCCAVVLIIMLAWHGLSRGFDAAIAKQQFERLKFETETQPYKKVLSKRGSARSQ